MYIPDVISMLKMEEVCSSETPVTIYESTHCHNPESTVRMSVSSEQDFINAN
jgi:hypothetical protein